MSCYNKVTYSKRDARATLNKLIRLGYWSHKEPGRIYECSWCNGWHITHHVDRDGGSERPADLRHKDKWKSLISSE